MSPNNTTFELGHSQTINCTSAIEVNTLSWINMNGTTVATLRNITMVELVLSQVNDSIHNMTLTCRAERMGQIEKEIVVLVSGNDIMHICISG